MFTLHCSKFGFFADFRGFRCFLEVEVGGSGVSQGEEVGSSATSGVTCAGAGAEVAVDLSVIGHDSQQGVSDGDFENVVHKCSFCGEEGHRRETCAKRKQVASRAVNLQTPKKSASRKGLEQVCSKCGGAGHNSRACKGGSRFKKK